MINKWMKHIGLVTTKHPKRVLIVFGIITIIMAGLASMISLELNWVSLAPKGHPSVQEYLDITEEFPTMDNMIVLIETDDYEKLEAVVKDLESELMELEPYVNNVIGHIDRDFLKENYLLFLETDEIEAVMQQNDPNLYAFLAALPYYLEGMNDDDLTDEEVMTYRQMRLSIVNLLERAEESNPEEIKELIEKAQFGETLFTNREGEMAIVTVQPTFDMFDFTKTMPGVNAIEDKVAEIESRYDGVEIGVTGMHVVARDETASVESDSQVTTIIAFIIIFIFLYVAFRSWLSPIFMFIPLVTGVIWTIGISVVTIGRLNMMTAFSAAMLIGLGIDYAIHLYSAYTEKRSKGVVRVEALNESLVGTGPSIVTGALTTAIAFLALNVSSLEMLRELGTIMATGIFTTLISVFYIIPSILMLRKEKEEKIKKIKGEFKSIGIVAHLMNKAKIPVFIILLLLTSFMGYMSLNIKFDTNLLNLEPVGLKSIELMERLVDKYDMSSDGFSVVVDSLDDVYEITEELKSIDGVFEVSSVEAILPKSELQKVRLNTINEYKSSFLEEVPYVETDQFTIDYVMSELEKIEGTEEIIKALKSIKDFDAVSKSFYDAQTELKKEIIPNKIIEVNDLPEVFKKQYVSNDGEKYLITVVPSFDMWTNLTNDTGNQFVDDLNEVYVGFTGTPIFMRVLYESVATELLLTGAVLFTLLVLLLFAHFRSIKYTLISFLPLVLTLIFTVGTMAIIDLPFNMINFLGLLLIIGIGIDDGVHVLHHYKQGERNIKQLFSSIGRAIFLTTLTTVSGFGSLMFSSYRGIATLGAVLSIGVTYAFIMTVITLPILLKNED